MAKAKYVFKFPPRLIEMPIASKLVSEHGLELNILRARVEPDEEGLLVVQLTGTTEGLKAGLDYVVGHGVEVEQLSKDITWRPELCVECTACRSICPTGALSVSVPDMKVTFDNEKCIACELCITACPYRAVEITF
jgi:ferredoxin